MEVVLLNIFTDSATLQPILILWIANLPQFAIRFTSRIGQWIRSLQSFILHLSVEHSNVMGLPWLVGGAALYVEAWAHSALPSTLRAVLVVSST